MNTRFLLFWILFFIGKKELTAQSVIYQHNFGSTSITSHPYTVAPPTLDANLSTSSWSNSIGAWTSFAGSSGQAIALSNSSGTPTFTFTFNIASGYELSIDSFRFWRQRSTSGAQNWSMTINGTTVGSGTNPTAGANTGSQAVSNPVTGITGTCTVVLSLSGATGTGTFRLDDFTLVGGVVQSVFPSVSFQSSVSSVFENQSTIDIPVEMTNISAPVTITASLSGTATNLVDYGINTTTLNFGTNGIQNFTISPVDNTVYGGDKTVIIDFTITSGTANLGISQHILTIQDNEPNPAKVIAFDSASRWVAGTGSALTSYSSGHRYISDSWTFYSNLALRETPAIWNGVQGALGAYAWRIKDTTGLTWYAVCNDTATVASFGFKHRRWNSFPPLTLDVDYSIDSGLTWTNAVTGLSYTNNTWQFYTYNIASPITTLPNKFIVRVSKATNMGRFMIDEFQFTRGTPGCFPTVTSGSTGTLRSICKENGWTYYGDNVGRYFAIRKGSSGLTGETVVLEKLTQIPLSYGTGGTNKEHASFLMKSGWNASGSIPSGQSVDIRFFYSPSDTADVTQLRNDSYDTLKGNGGTLSGTNPSTQAIKTPFQWFKTVGLPYDASWRSSITGNQFPSSHIKLTPIYGMQNGSSYVEFQGITSFSGGSGGAGYGAGSGIGLPVTWSGFDVTVSELGNILVWKTSSELNTSHFNVEYSYDGMNFFKSSRTIPAAGYSTSMKTYSYTHPDFSSYVYYRIKQVDKDGRSENSVTKVAKRAQVVPFQVSVHPIPMYEENELHITVKSIDQSNLSIRFIDMNGREVLKKTVVPTMNYIDQKFALDHLSGGIYQIEVQNGQGKELIKFVK